jgi:hypothetical protein
VIAVVAAVIERNDLREELDADVQVGELVLHSRHAYPDRTVGLYFYRCGLIGTPRPQLGQEMRWFARAELGSLSLPPADAELIELLTKSGAR